ncbi:hypothetical protein PROFUN_03629 [Planoprotostelium fungivorum]|uniref:Protein BCCIP homolog n=1 Tax=Planoprotostelium fungivorum TaxID=1890364 RepID=A0A2P6NSE6_9EUKA|nr:hypothetical protein PROFUN_03629 [Planoprotostelium fungivorum]
MPKKSAGSSEIQEKKGIGQLFESFETDTSQGLKEEKVKKVEKEEKEKKPKKAADVSVEKKVNKRKSEEKKIIEEPEESKPEKKKKKVEKEEVVEEEEEQEDEDKEDEEDGDEEEVDIDFDLKEIVDTDFHPLKSLLKNYLADALFDSSGFIDLILAQNVIGSTIKVDQDEAVTLGLITMLSLSHHKKQECVKQFISYITSHCPQQHKKKLDKVLDEKKVGLLVNERMVNVPLELAPPLHQILYDDIEKAKKDSPAEFTVDYLIMLSKSCSLTEEAEEALVQETLGKKAKKSNSESDNRQRFHLKAEDELYIKAADFSFDFLLPSTAEGEDQPLMNGDAQVYRHIIVIPYKKAVSVSQTISALIE